MITFFGASITVQNKGYANVLSNKYFVNDKCKIFGFGGMHLNDAGIAYIHIVLEKKPKLCFIDWFSTGLLLNKYDDIKIYLDTLVFALSDIKCKIVFLFMPNKNHDVRKNYYGICKKYLINNKLSYIDLTEAIQYNPKYIRDNCHTTDEGGIAYAKYIYEEFKKIENNIIIPQNSVPTKYNNIKYITVNQTFEDSFILEGKCEIVGFNIDVGPHSGLVQVNDGNIVKEFNFWEQWCYYTRRTLRFRYNIENCIKITILQDNFDTSKCQKQFDFSGYKKELKIYDIYFIGDKLSIK
jgi:hypothetical protein